MLDTDKEQQFLEAHTQHSDAIFRYCYYRVFDREKAKDYVQETYLRTWKYLAEGRKKKATSLDQIMEKGFAPNTDPRQKTQDHFTGQELIAIIKSLDDKYKDVILMKYLDDLSTKEIALVLNETENNIYVRLSRGLEKVKEIIKHQEN